MDNLKTLNDTLGHEAGDVALQLLAGALRSGLRRGDDAYRLGGDEFAVVLPGANRLDAEREATRRLRERDRRRARRAVKASRRASASPSTSPASADRLVA